MLIAKKIVHNTMYQTAGRIIGTAFAFAAIVLMSRYLGTSKFGEFIIILSIVQFCGVVTDFGIHLITLQDIAQAGADKEKLISLNFTFRCFINLGIFIFFLIAVPFFPYSQTIKLGILIMSFSNFFLSLNLILVTVFQENLHTGRAAVSEIGGRVVNLAGVFIIIVLKMGVLAMVAASTFAFFVNLVISLLLSRKFLRLRLCIDYAYFQKLAERTWPIALSIIFTLIYFKTDTIILSLFHPPSEVGIYGIPYRILETLSTLPPLFVFLIMPYLARFYARRDFKNLGHMVQNSFDTLAAIAVPFSAGAFMLGKPIIRLVAGESYDRAIPIFSILMLATSMIFLSSTFTHAILILEKQKMMLKYYIVTAVITFTLYVLLIPHYSMWAASLLTLFSEMLILYFSWNLVRRYSQFRLNVSGLMKSVIAALCMSALLFPLRALPLFLTLPFGVIVYLAALLTINPKVKAAAVSMIKTKNPPAGGFSEN